MSFPFLSSASSDAATGVSPAVAAAIAAANASHALDSIETYDNSPAQSDQGSRRSQVASARSHRMPTRSSVTTNVSSAATAGVAQRYDRSTWSLAEAGSIDALHVEGGSGDEEGVEATVTGCGDWLSRDSNDDYIDGRAVGPSEYISSESGEEDVDVGVAAKSLKEGDETT